MSIFKTVFGPLAMISIFFLNCSDKSNITPTNANESNQKKNGTHIDRVRSLLLDKDGNIVKDTLISNEDLMAQMRNKTDTASSMNPFTYITPYITTTENYSSLYLYITSNDYQSNFVIGGAKYDLVPGQQLRLGPGVEAGTRIVSQVPVTVSYNYISGSGVDCGAVLIPYQNCGNEYIVPEIDKNGNEKQWISVHAFEDGTYANLPGGGKWFNAGEGFYGKVQTGFTISSNKPVSVVEFISYNDSSSNSATAIYPNDK